MSLALRTLLSQAILLDGITRTPHVYIFVGKGVIAGAFTFNLFLVCMVLYELHYMANAHDQRFFFYVREVLWGGLNPLPHSQALRAGELTEVDFEVNASFMETSIFFLIS